MRKNLYGSIMTLSVLCILLVLMCTFFIEPADAATVKKGTSTKKEQTIKLTLKKGVAIVKIKNKNGWEFAQIQTTGSNKKASPVGGVSTLSETGKSATFVAPIKKAGTYYLYLNGKKKGATYIVNHVSAGGKLKSGVTKKSTSYTDDVSVVFYTIKVPAKGRLDVVIKDASYLYPGYSKVRLKKDGALISGEEDLIDGLGFRTTYGVTKGTYKIGVRSSSELYRIRATFSKVKTTQGGKKKAKAKRIYRKSSIKNIVVPGSKTARWYKLNVPKRRDDLKRIKIKLTARNSNVDIYGGIRFGVMYKYKKNGKTKTYRKAHLVNNDTVTLKMNTKKGEDRMVYIKVSGYKQASGVYGISYN